MHELLQDTPENRSHGFISVGTNCPAWAQARILEVRSAIVEKRTIPAPSREFIAGCEQRSALAARSVKFVNRLFPTPRRDQRCYEDILEDRLRKRAARLAAEIRADERRLQAAAEARRLRELEEERQREIDNTRLSIFPWERRN